MHEMDGKEFGHLGLGVSLECEGYELLQVGSLPLPRPKHKNRPFCAIQHEGGGERGGMGEGEEGRKGVYSL